VTVCGVARIIVSVEDLDRSLRLYRDALGLTESYRLDELAMLRVAPAGPEVMLHQRPPTAGLASVAIGYTVDDVDAATLAAVAAGATIVDPPADEPWGERQSVLTDPDGHVICLVSPPR
jgi:catechol 2,3-dioxygenase-like lactoylglutathione lyase family enzyme